ncbi:MAG: hypothetical protein JW778_02130 [Candidatus Altiarchaeota archaeon]|nr:hypothetical protein [Candidatus Altiarchaeota archaeon]
MLELIYGTKTKTRILEELATAGKPKTRKELIELTGCGTRGVYEQTEELITLGIVKETKKGWKKLELNPEHPLYQDIKNTALAAIDYKKNLIKNLLQTIDQILEDDYYIGFYTAATKKITPIDYTPEKHVYKVLDTEYEKKIKKIKTYDKLREIDIQKEKKGLIKAVFLKCQKIPEDVTREEIQNQEVWIASTERGIVECFTPENKYFTRYGSCLALLQNKIENTIDEKQLLKIAGELNIKKELVKVMGSFNHHLKKRLFNAEPNTEEIKEVKQAINTVLG